MPDKDEPNKLWLKWERRMGKTVPATRTIKRRDEMLNRLLTLGGRDPVEFHIDTEAPEVGPMYRRPVPPRVMEQIDKAMERLEELKKKAKKKKQISQLNKVRDFLAKAKLSPEKEVLLVNPGRHPSILAHEVGHASRPNLPAKFISGATTHFADNPTVGALNLLLGAAGGALKSPGAVGTSLGLGALRGLTRLTEEGRASLRGLDLLRQSGHEPTPEEKKALRQAWTSYLPSAASDVMSPAIMSGLGYLGRLYALKHASLEGPNMYKQSNALQALVDFRKRAASSPTAATSSGPSTAPSASSSMKVEGPSMKSMSYNTPSTGHIGLFKATGFSNTGRIKISEEPSDFPWGGLTVPTGLLAGAGIGGLVKARGNPKVLVDMIRKGREREAMELLAPLLIGSGVGGTAGAIGGSYLENRMPKEGALSKFALGIKQPSMITSSMRSAAGRQGGYTAGNLAKGSGAFKPTRLTSILSEGKSSAMDKTALKTSFLCR